MIKRGRPKVKIDLKEAEKLGGLQCTYAEAAAFMDIPEGTLKNREDFTTVFKKGAEYGKTSLRRIQFKMAEKSPAMAIWLGKQYLGQREPEKEVSVELPFNYEFTNWSDKKLKEYVDNGRNGK